jgi:hypothetical protein
MNDNWTSPQALDTEKKNRVNWWVWLVVASLVCVCLAGAGIVGFVMYFGQEPEGLSLEYTIPSVVSNGENFELILTITNSNSNPVTVSGIYLDNALADSLLDGSIVLETEPPMERDYSIESIKIFNYNQSINPGETISIVFHLQAITIGEFGGPIAIYVGDFAKGIDYVGITIQK